ncbi:MAG: aminotransferase class I/II-fold pyridoxal phosphate-dependent enzyme, partial [Myxococcaceae bacterium]|nr:aminotransferase class I/II-fold pyridoxal phosphate-dependent enzyme [Myxococcaceae bacterium]
MTLWPRHHIDLRASDLLVAATSRGRAEPEQRFSPDSIATLSVRSAFDLLLGALALAPGSELVVSDVTIPHMAAIARAHGLSVVPVPLDFATAAPTADALERALSPRTGAVLVAHLFGGRMNVLPLLEVCRRRGVPLIEDCAQAWVGPHDAGHPGALA